MQEWYKMLSLLKQFWKLKLKKNKLKSIGFEWKSRMQQKTFNFSRLGFGFCILHFFREK